MNNVALGITAVACMQAVLVAQTLFVKMVCFTLLQWGYSRIRISNGPGSHSMALLRSIGPPEE